MLDHDSAFQRQLLFCFDEKQMRNRLGGRTLRSDVDIDYDVEPHAVASSNFKELSRYALEDILGCSTGRPLILCISKALDASFNQKLANASEQQKLAGRGDT